MNTFTLGSNNSPTTACVVLRVGQHKLMCASVEIRQNTPADQFGYGFPEQCTVRIGSLVGPQSVLDPLIKQWSNVLNAKSSKLLFECKTETEGCTLEINNLVLTEVQTSMKADGLLLYESLSFVGTSCVAKMLDPLAPLLLSVEEMRAFVPTWPASPWDSIAYMGTPKG